MTICEVLLLRGRRVQYDQQLFDGLMLPIRQRVQGEMHDLITDLLHLFQQIEESRVINLPAKSLPAIQILKKVFVVPEGEVFRSMNSRLLMSGDRSAKVLHAE